MAAVESIEEAVVNAVVAGEDVETVKPAGQICRGIDRQELAALFGEHKLVSSAWLRTFGPNRVSKEISAR